MAHPHDHWPAQNEVFPEIHTILLNYPLLCNLNLCACSANLGHNKRGKGKLN